MAATRNGTPINVPAAGTITWPAATNFALAGIYYDGASQAVTALSGSRITVDGLVAVPSTDYMGVYFAWGRINSSGSDTISRTKSGFFSEGPTCQVQCYDCTVPANFGPRDYEVVGNVGGVISRTIDSLTTDLVDAWIMSDGGGNVSGSISGFTAAGTAQTVNADQSNMFRANSPGASSTSITGPNNSYPGLVIASFYESGGAPTAYELLGTPGVYSLAGSTARLSRTRKLFGTPGAYALSGSTARLNLFRRLLGTPGSYALSGSTARLAKASKLLGTPGVYSLAGSSVRLTGSFKLLSDPGTYSIVGSDGELTVVEDLNLIGTPGVYTLTGSPATLLASRLLLSTPGAYSIAGAEARLVAGKLVIGDEGSMGLVGSPAKLTVARRLVGEPGVLILTGFPAELEHITADKELLAQPGTYQITGFPAEFTYTPLPSEDLPDGGVPWPALPIRRKLLEDVDLLEPLRTPAPEPMPTRKAVPPGIHRFVHALHPEVLPAPPAPIQTAAKPVRRLDPMLIAQWDED